MFLSRLSVRRPVLMTMVVGVFVVFGIVAYQKMPVELLPPVDLPYIMIQLVYPGASPEDVETSILTPLEEELGRVNNVRTLRTTAVPDGGRVILELEMGTDPDAAVEQIRTVLEQIDSRLPPAMREPLVQAIDLRAAPVMSIAVTGDRDVAALTAWSEDHVELALSRVEGAALVELVGDRRPEAHVDVDQERLLAHHLTLGHVVEAVRKGGVDLPAGIIEDRDQAVPVRLASAYRSDADLAAVMIEAPTGERIPLSAVAQVGTTVSPEITRARIGGQPCIGVGVYKMADANTVALGKRLRDQVEAIRADMPEDVELTVIYDASGAISTSVNNLALTMALSILLTASLLYLFLHDLRGTAIVAITIPATIVATLTFVYLAGFSINYMTLMGLAITVGTMVDASIVVLESIARQAKEESDAAAAADRGTGRVMLGVIGSTVTNIAVFTPIAFMEGIAGQFFLQFAMTITFAMVFALFMSFTLTPMLASYLYRRNGPLARIRPGPVARLWERGFTVFSGQYRGVLRWCLGHRAATVVGLLLVFAATLGILGRVVSLGWFVDPDQGFFVMQVDMPNGTSLDDTERAVRRCERVLDAHPAVGMHFATVGQFGTLFGALNNRSMAEFRVSLEPGNDTPSTASVIEELRPVLAHSVPGAAFTLKELGGGEMAVRDDLMIEIRGPDPEVLSGVAQRVEDALEVQPNVVDIERSGDELAPQIRVVPDVARTAQAGLTPADLALLLRVAIEGDTDARLRAERKEIPVRVRLRARDRDGVAAIGATTIQTASGAQVPLRELARVEEVEAPSAISRMERDRLITVFANLSHGAIGDTTAALEAAIDPDGLPAGYTVRVGGEEDQRAEATAEIAQALLLAIILTYMLLSGLLESFVHPLSILSTLPLALVGVLVALASSGVVMDIFGLMALVMLVGIVVNNAILMIEETQQQRRAGVPIAEALEKGALLRLRPILMTTLSTIAGMVPLALALGQGAELRQAMALVSIGGVAVSSVLILVACPVLFHLTESALRRA